MVHYSYTDSLWDIRRWQIEIISFVKEVLMKFYGQIIMATNIQKFSKRLKFGYSRIANEKENLSILRANSANWASHLKDSNYQMKNS